MHKNSVFKEEKLAGLVYEYRIQNSSIIGLGEG